MGLRHRLPISHSKSSSTDQGNLSVNHLLHSLARDLYFEHRGDLTFHAEELAFILITAPAADADDDIEANEKEETEQEWVHKVLASSMRASSEKNFLACHNCPAGQCVGAKPHEPPPHQRCKR